MTTATHRRFSPGRFRPIRLGYVPSNDSAPVVVAFEQGWFERQDVDVQLSRELGWASVREKLIRGGLDAAVVPCGLPLALHLGLNGRACEVVVGLILNQHGGAITLSEHLWSAGIRDAASLRLHAQVHRTRHPLHFGISSTDSSHGYLLRKWYSSGGLQGMNDAQIVVLPGPLMPGHLAAGHIDGFCASEPWNSVAVAQARGWVPSTGAQLAPGHPGKVVAARMDLVRNAPQEHARMLAALLVACRWCQDPANVASLATLLSHPRYLGIAPELIRSGLSGRFDHGHGRLAMHPDLIQFDGNELHEPQPSVSAWIVRHVMGEEAGPRLTPERLRGIFRRDLYLEAKELVRSRASKAPAVVV